MGARTGEQFLEGLADRREVWLNGTCIDDVTSAPALQGAARTLAELFDLQFAHPDELLMSDVETGEQVAVSHLIPRSADDIRRRHVALERIALHTLGLLGRSPDYLNVTLAGFAGPRRRVGAERQRRGAENLVRFQREALLGDFADDPCHRQPDGRQVRPEVDAGDGKVALHLVGESADGIVVRGARALATLAPFADEMVVYPGQPIPGDATGYALAFSIPMTTPGCASCAATRSPRRATCSTTRCRHGSTNRTPSSSSTTSSCPASACSWPATRRSTTGDETGWVANIMQQTTIRAHVKLASPGSWRRRWPSA